MDRLIATDSVNLAGADVAPLVGVKQYATDGNPGAGIPATVWPAYQYNAIQEEIIAAILASGQATDNTKLDQLVRALQIQRPNYAAATGTNVYAITLNPVPASYAAIIGMPIRVKFTNGMTGTGCTLNVNGLGAKGLVRPTNLGLFYSDIVAGAVQEVVYDGTNFQLSALLAAAQLGSGQARTTVVPNTNVATDIFAAVEGNAQVYLDFGGGNAFCDSLIWYQGGALDVRRAGSGAPGTRTYTLASSVLQLALSGAPGAATVSPQILQSSSPTP